MFLCRPNIGTALPVSEFGGSISKLSFGAASCSVIVTFNTDGTVTGSQSGASGTFINGATNDRWFKPTTAGIGSKYWIQFTLVSGDLPSGGDLFLPASPAQLNTNRSVIYNSGTGGAVSSSSGTLNFTITEGSGGPVVCSGTYLFSAERES